jgi:hypothetical protein
VGDSPSSFGKLRAGSNLSLEGRGTDRIYAKYYLYGGLGAWERIRPDRRDARSGSVRGGRRCSSTDAASSVYIRTPYLNAPDRYVEKELIE